VVSGIGFFSALVATVVAMTPSAARERRVIRSFTGRRVGR
jgi:hypothetical protein